MSANLLVMKIAVGHTVHQEEGIDFMLSTVDCKKKFPFCPRKTGIERLDRCRFYTVTRVFNFLHETIRSIAMYVRR